VNWLADVAGEAIRCGVKLRARDAVRGAVVQVADGDVRVVLDEPALPAPGQACVFYAGEQVLGGGIIVRGDVGAAS
jgi:tRNA-specific 2-thiouridylase